MVFKNLASVVENNFEEISQSWLKEAKQSENMKSYQTLGDDELMRRGKAVLENLIIWLKAGALSEEVEEYFEKVGVDRLSEGFPLTEVQYALYLTKKNFWNFVDWRDTITGAFETKTATEIMTVFNNYFDLGNFYITRGYLQELFNRLSETKKFSKNELKKFLIEGSDDWESLNEEDIIWRHV